MKKLIVLTIVLLSFHQIINAQGQKDNFQGFREKMLSDFQNYRQSVLDKYADFLAGIWKDYDVNVGYKWNPLPKPKQQPAKDKDTPAPPPKSIEPENIKGISFIYDGINLTATAETKADSGGSHEGR